MSSFSSFDKQDLSVVSSDGSVRCKSTGIFTGEVIFVPDKMAKIHVGDEIRRMLPNGEEEAFVVVDPRFYDGAPFGPHFQVKVNRKGSFEAGKGGNYDVNITGANARVNIHSVDNSTNWAINSPVFSRIRSAINDGVVGEGDSQELLQFVDEMEQANDKETFVAAFNKFVTKAGPYMSILGPFIPLLTELMTE